MQTYVKGVRGRARRSTSLLGRGKKSIKSNRAAKESGAKFDVHDLSKVDNDIPNCYDFEPWRSVGVHHLLSSNELTPADIFKLYLDPAIVDVICSATNEYAERNKSKYPTMLAYYDVMNPEKFYKVVGILVHLGYHKIPRPRLMWSPTSLCFDLLVSQVLSRNKFDGIMTFLHLVHEDTEKKLKDNGDKLCKVRPVYDYISQKCDELYNPIGKSVLMRGW